MKQLIQHLRTGQTEILEVPAPALQSGQILVRSVCSVISTGTEKMLVEFSKGSLISKARQQPERVAQVLDKMKTDGILPTLEAVFNKLDTPLPLGYSNAGIVLAVSNDVTQFKVGDHVITNGTHAEINAVPVHMAAKIPDGVSFENAAYTVIASVGMQAIRLASPQIGDVTVVIGLGLIGALTCQLLRAQGSRVIGYDIDESKRNSIRQSGFETVDGSTADFMHYVQSITSNRGADQVLIAASASDDQLINTAAQLARQKGKIILIGVVNMQFDRTPFYQKELSFQVSSSYGPGRYDAQYEEKGIDYPAAYVRFTAQRNFESVLYAMASGALNPAIFTSAKIAFENAADAYATIGKDGHLATLIQYAEHIHSAQTIIYSTGTHASSHIHAGIIGAGNFTKMTLLPALKELQIPVHAIASNSGMDATILARKYQIPAIHTDPQKILQDTENNLVIITTRHDSHAQFAIDALKAGKHVYVEKPLALTRATLDNVRDAFVAANGFCLFVGFNRRHAPLSKKAKAAMGDGANSVINIVVNAGSLPADHWLQDVSIGGGRLVGEACHFVDLFQYFAGSPITRVFAVDNSPGKNHEQAIIHLTCANGAQGNIVYTANGSKSYPKETITIFNAGKVITLDNFRKLTIHGNAAGTTSSKQDKGLRDQLRSIRSTIESGDPMPVSFATLYNVSLAAIAIQESIQLAQPISI